MTIPDAAPDESSPLGPILASMPFRAMRFSSEMNELMCFFPTTGELKSEPTMDATASRLRMGGILETVILLRWEG